MTEYFVKYPNAYLKISKYQDSPQLSLTYGFNSKDAAQNFALQTHASLKDNFYKALDGEVAKLISKNSGQEIICEDNCDITIHKIFFDDENCEGLARPNCHVDNTMLGTTFSSYLEDTISF